MPFFKKEQFIWNFIKKNEFPSCYEEIQLKAKDYKYVNSEQGNYKEKLSKVIYVSLFPSIFNPIIAESNSFNLKKKQHLKLSSVVIFNNNFEDADTYLKKHLKASFRSNIRKRTRKLEASFDVSYKMFYGDISQNEHAHLMDTLQEMLVKRFQQKSIENEILSTFEEYKNTTYDLINNKKASLFVIYNDKTPIAISLNYHVDKMFFGTIMTYDIDYAKFGLGNTLIYKLLDWTLKNNYLIFDMGNGESEYKRNWSDNVYDYEYHIIYKKGSIPAYIIAHIEIIKIVIKNCIKSLKIDFYLKS